MCIYSINKYYIKNIIGTVVLFWKTLTSIFTFHISVIVSLFYFSKSFFHLWNAAKSAPSGWCCHCGATPTYIWTETGELLFRPSPVVALFVRSDSRLTVGVLRHRSCAAWWALCAIFPYLGVYCPPVAKSENTRKGTVLFFLNCFVPGAPLFADQSTLSMCARGMFHGWIAPLHEAQRGLCLRPGLHLIFSFSPLLLFLPSLLFSLPSSGASAWPQRGDRMSSSLCQCRPCGEWTPPPSWPTDVLWSRAHVWLWRVPSVGCSAALNQSQSRWSPSTFFHWLHCLFFWMTTIFKNYALSK